MMKSLSASKRTCSVINEIIISFLVITCMVVIINAGTEEDAFRTLAENYGAPLIEPPRSEITAMVMEEFRIPCHASTPITWVTIHNEHHEIIRDLYVEYTINETSRFSYVATLVFHSVTVDNVAFYYCIKNQSLELVDLPADLDNEVNLFRATKTYLFVQDDANPLVPIHNPVLSVRQFEPYTVPCKPSSKDVEVELIRLDDEPSKAINAAKFDPKLGFTTRFREVHDSTYYLCRPKGQDEPSHIIEISFLLSYNELEARTDFITVPTINSTSEGGFVYVGGQITLFCYVDIKAGVSYDMHWYFKGLELSNSDKYSISTTSENKSGTDELVKVGTKSLTILGAEVSDSGNYRCSVKDHNHHTNDRAYTVEVLETRDSVLVLNTSLTSISATQGTEAQLVFDYESFPNASFEILKDGQRLVMDDRYHLNILYKEHKVMFNMKDVHVDDTANYTLIADNGMKSINRTVQVFIETEPIVMLQPEEVYAKINKTVVLLCTSLSYPPAVIEWSYRKCEVDEWLECARELPGKWPANKKTRITKDTKPMQKSENNTIDNVDIKQTINTSNLFTRTANYTAKLRFSGVARCIASNTHGVDIRSTKIMTGDLDQPVMIWKHNPDQIVAEGDEVRLECGVIKFNYTQIIMWKHDGKWINPSYADEIDIIESDTEHSYRSTLVIKNVDLTSAGQYVCVARGLDPTKSPDEVRYYLEVHQRRQARIINSNLTDESISVNLGDSLDMFCDVDGVPPPEIEWTKDDELLKNNSYNILIGKTGKRAYARIIAVKVEHEGQYKCTVSNKDGRDFQTAKLIINNRPFKYLLETTIGVFAVILLLVGCTIYLCVRVKKEKDTVRALKKIGLANFEEGDIDRFNPELDLNEQAEILPYDRRFEFPRDKLKLGQQLGAGAFGVVIKAVAKGIIPYEDETTVAVKMVKANTDDEVMRALISELKIMVHLGQHLNVVNLLGAVTKNITRREVMVIVEYCRFGNTQKFLLKHRTYFVDQINKETDEIDPNITENEYRWSKNSVYNFRTSGATAYSSPRHVNSQGYARQSEYGVDSANTEATLISRGGDSDRPLSSTSQNEYRAPNRTVTTSDLVCWAFQVARGMDYLASRKVLHGDLAARNILLCDDNIVKICDFGLARSLYNNENYKKNNETPLPFKWLALESLSDQVFSTYSDIWAFGVTMWEFFSLAQTPYPGIDPNRDLYLKLMDGYRMEKPKYANQRLYDIMLSCWNQKPETRPAFHVLERQLSALMEDGVKDHYLDLNEPYLQANVEYLKTNPDYLAMLNQGPPDFMAPKAPMATHEEFHVPDVEAPPVPGAAIYTPSSENYEDNDISVAEALTHKTSPVQKPLRKKKDRRNHSVDDDIDGPGENIPMLESNFNGNDSKDAVISNQYVNVPSAAKHSNKKSKAAVSNPSYIAVRNVNEKT